MKTKSSERLARATWLKREMKMKDEKSLQKYLSDRLKDAGCLVYKFASPNKRGVPDLIVITPYHSVLFIEVKSPTGKGRLSKLQEHEIALLIDHGMTVMVIASQRQADGLISRVKGR